MAVLLFAIVTGWIALEVLLRAPGAGSIMGIVDFVEASIYSMALLAAPWIQYKHAHVRVMILPEALPVRWRYYLELVSLGICVLVCSILTYYAFHNFFTVVERNELYFSDLIFPEWYLHWQAPFAFLLLAVGFLRDLLMTSESSLTKAALVKE